MSAACRVHVRGLGAWAPGLPDWASWRALLRGEGGVASDAAARPRPNRLAPGERRRVSTHVLAAVEVADQAVAAGGHDAAALPCVFTSAHGDAGIMDYMCAVLADTPQHLSPTRFHNSVHNAAVGYWTIATGCRAPSNAVAATGAASFGAGLLEAAVQAVAEDRPVLLVAHDDPATGPLGDVLGTTAAFACAMVLAPARADAAAPCLELALEPGDGHGDAPRHPHAANLARCNPSAPGLALLEALATGGNTRLRLPAAPRLDLCIDVTATP